MKRSSSLIFALLVYISAFSGNKTTIIPEFELGRTYKYHLTETVSGIVRSDSVDFAMGGEVQLTINSKDENGYTATSRLRMGTPEYDVKNESILQAFMLTLDVLRDLWIDEPLKMHINKLGQPDSILNYDDILETYTQYYLISVKKTLSKDMTEEAWEQTGKPYVINYVKQQFDMSTIIDQHYTECGGYKLYGKSIEDGEVDLSELFNDKLITKPLASLKTLNITITRPNAETIIVDAAGRNLGTEVNAQWRFKNNQLVESEISNTATAFGDLTITKHLERIE